MFQFCKLPKEVQHIFVTLLCENPEQFWEVSQKLKYLIWSIQDILIFDLLLKNALGSQAVKPQKCAAPRCKACKISTIYHFLKIPLLLFSMCYKKGQHAGHGFLLPNGSPKEVSSTSDSSQKSHTPFCKFPYSTCTYSYVLIPMWYYYRKKVHFRVNKSNTFIILW